MAGTEETAIVILAAGASTRMGKPKQLLEIRGETLIQRVCRLALQTGCKPIVVVLGANERAIKNAMNDLANLLQFVQNQQWKQGMSTSLRAGIQSLSTYHPKPKAVLVLLVDQPFVNSELLKQLQQESVSNPTKIVATHYGEVLGVPAIFPDIYFDRLSQIEGDKGARQVIVQHKDQVVSIPFPKAAFDLDTPEDWEQWGGG